MLATEILNGIWPSRENANFIFVGFEPWFVQPTAQLINAVMTLTASRVCRVGQSGQSRFARRDADSGRSFIEHLQSARQLIVAFLKAELLRHPASRSMLSRNPPTGVQLLRRRKEQ